MMEIVPSLLCSSGVIASDLTITPTFGVASVNAGATSGKYATINSPQSCEYLVECLTETETPVSRFSALMLGV